MARLERTAGDAIEAAVRSNGEKRAVLFRTTLSWSPGMRPAPGDTGVFREIGGAEGICRVESAE